MKNSIGIYIHIPFCKAKCYYCDFNSYSGREHLAGSYFCALKDEILSRSASVRGRRVDSIFIGGGTPSLVDPAYIRGLLELCTKEFDIAKDAEISIESNPGTLDYQKLRRYKEMGINRLSIGLQAWQDSLLRSIGRIHDRKQFIDNVNAAVEAGFDNINADLIFGLPGQTFEDWAETLAAVAAMGTENHPYLKHISCYSLKIEEGTVLGDRLDAGTLVPVDDDLDRRMYHYAVDYLAEKGFRHYEISNFARPGYESRHNLIYWKAKEYAGFGAGAHSFLDSVRFNSVSGIEEYIMAVAKMRSNTASGCCNVTKSVFAEAARTLMGTSERCAEAKFACTEPTDRLTEMSENSAETKVDQYVQSELFEDMQIIDKNEAMAEFMILGFRLTDGVSSAEFWERFGERMETVYGDRLEKLLQRGLVLREKDPAIKDCETYVYRLTRLGLDLANSVFIEFI